VASPPEAMSRWGPAVVGVALSPNSLDVSRLRRPRICAGAEEVEERGRAKDEAAEDSIFADEAAVLAVSCRFVEG
jgi:hypothetical protein